MLDIIDLSEWKTRKEILNEYNKLGIHVADRTFRKVVEENNKRFYNHETEWFIAHGTKGYIKTKDNDIIQKSIMDGKKRAITLLKIYRDTKKALGENDNLKLELENEEIING